MSSSSPFAAFPSSYSYSRRTKPPSSIVRAKVSRFRHGPHLVSWENSQHRRSLLAKKEKEGRPNSRKKEAFTFLTMSLGLRECSRPLSPRRLSVSLAVRGWQKSCFCQRGGCRERTLSVSRTCVHETLEAVLSFFPLLALYADVVKDKAPFPFPHSSFLLLCGLLWPWN